MNVIEFEIYRRAYLDYLDIQRILDDALGPDEEDGAGQVAADVALLAKQRDEARAELAKLRQVTR